MPLGAGARLIGIGVAQTIAWGSSYYLPAVLAPAIARDLAVSSSFPFLGLTLALLIAAGIGPLAGRAIDRWGGRRLLSGSSLLFALGLTALATSADSSAYLGAWLVLGVAMGCGLYEAAFATLVRWRGDQARPAITHITLIAGLASTVSWPATAALSEAVGWRGACLAWALLHLLICLPVHAALPRHPRHAAAEFQPEPPPARLPAILLAGVFAVSWFISTAMAAHLPLLLQASGIDGARSVALAALVGPAQVAARLIESAWLIRWHPLLSARLAAALHPLGALAFLTCGSPAAIAFALLHGAGNGILTIAIGTLPLALFGVQGYGARLGWLMVPARFCQATAPLIFGLALERYGPAALVLSIALAGCALCALLLLRPQAACLSRRSRSSPLPVPNGGPSLRS
ncbi:MAG: MFS transporter [Planctomycetota bacterium]|nr:MFS transporter [Planctomycetota bacterium]MDW8373831.1 MFS transporter [Planctomycetota bacterium]